MKCIQDYSFHDGKILSIFVSYDCVEILFEKWDCKQIKLYFEDYRKIKDSHSVGQDISELLITSSNEILDEVITDILNGGGAKEEAVGLNSYSFINSWEESVIFEIVARNVKVEELIS